LYVGQNLLILCYHHVLSQLWNGTLLLDLNV
jgi:hypothetical protein